MSSGRPENPRIPKPVVAEQPRLPPKKTALKDVKFAVSFAYWKQIDNFGLAPRGDDSAWFVSFLDGLRSIGTHSVEEIQCDFTLREKLNMHKFDWSRENMGIGISRARFEELIPQKYKGGPEYEPLQIQVGTGHGRLIGFFDENNIFQILLLDPNHNFCLSAFSDYRVRPTKIKLSQFELLHNELLAIKTGAVEYCKKKPCPALETINDVLASSAEKHFVCLTDVEPEIVNVLYSKYSGDWVSLTCDMVDLFMATNKDQAPRQTEH